MPIGHAAMEINLEAAITYSWQTSYIVIKSGRRRAKKHEIIQVEPMDASVTVSFRRRESFLVIIDRKWILSELCSDLYLPAYKQMQKEWVHHNMDMAACKGWSHLSKAKQGVSRIDPPGNEDIFSVSTEPWEGQNWKSCSIHRLLPSMPATSHNCYRKHYFEADPISDADSCSKTNLISHNKTRCFSP